MGKTLSHQTNRRRYRTPERGSLIDPHRRDRVTEKLAALHRSTSGSQHQRIQDARHAIREWAQLCVELGCPERVAREILALQAILDQHHLPLPAGPSVEDHQRHSAADACENTDREDHLLEPTVTSLDRYVRSLRREITAKLVYLGHRTRQLAGLRQSCESSPS